MNKSQMHPGDISIDDFDYPLPKDRIALYPLEERDASKLLVYQQGIISEDAFVHLPKYINSNDMLVFNNSRVINARIKFKKPSGGVIEIFCLEPADVLQGYGHALNNHSGSVWKCLVGGMSKWKSGPLTKFIQLNNKEIILSATISGRTEDAWQIRFSWNEPGLSFLDIIEATGQVPLPPYIKREVEPSDRERYQTIYAQIQGSVAAPTAGLHFTNRVLDELKKKQVTMKNLTLHVGAGTFKPVSTHLMHDHIMHSEWIEITTELLTALIQSNQKTIAVGTTSIRTLESIYWIGCKIIKEGSFDLEKGLSQWEIYQNELFNTCYSKRESLEATINFMADRKMKKLFTQTQLLITPGYIFKMTDGLVTNFHQPKSTLLLLVAAATNNHWREIYDYAMSHDFRFLSYGDSSLIVFDDEVKAQS